MAFWKKSEDPWDMDPSKKKREPTVYHTVPEEVSGLKDEPEDEGFLAEVAGLFKKKSDPLEELPPMNCPWCGKEMTKGYLMGGRDAMRWSVEKPGTIFGSAFLDTVQIRDEDIWNNYKTCWHCIPCRRLVVDVPEQKEEMPFGWDGNPPSHPGVEEETD